MTFLQKENEATILFNQSNKANMYHQMGWVELLFSFKSIKCASKNDRNSIIYNLTNKSMIRNSLSGNEPYITIFMFKQKIKFSQKFATII